MTSEDESDHFRNKNALHSYRVILDIELNKQKNVVKRRKRAGQAGTKTCKRCQTGIRQISSANLCFLCKY